MTNDDTTAKLHIDSDWKAEAQAEKQRLAADEKAKAAAQDGADGGQGPRDLPEASFRTLVSMLASQAIMGLGAMQDPETKGVVIDLDGARFSIDLLGVLEEKTKGNLSNEEAEEMKQLSAELRSRYVQVSALVAKQMQADATGAGAASGMAAGPGGPGGSGAPGGSGGSGGPGPSLRTP